MTKTTKYTYLEFANDVKELCHGTIEMTPQLIEKICLKADDLIATQLSKQAYNRDNPKKTEAKGASKETMFKAELIKTALDNIPKTTTEINALLGTEYSALQVANAVKFIDGAVSSKVIRETITGTGLKQEKLYTGYSLK